MNQEKLLKIYSAYADQYKISTDSRTVGQGDVYLALKGDRFDGNQFAEQALQNGARLAVVDDDRMATSDNIIHVDDGLHCLQQLALLHRRKLNIPVIALTGSNGKTTTKELMATCLATKFKINFTQGNLNNHIGVPLTILNTRPEHELLVVEMGANHIGEIHDLCTIAEPDLGLITNIGKAHLEGFGSYEGVIEAKTEMYRYLQSRGAKVLFNADDDSLAMHTSEYEAALPYNVSDYEMISSYPLLSFELNGMQYDTKLVGAYNLANVATAIAVGQAMGVGVQDMLQAITSYIPSNNRSQLIQRGHTSYIADAYNANPSSMQLSIKAFGESDIENKVLVLGDMLELGEDAEVLHREILELVTKYSWEKVILVGALFQSQSDVFGQYEFVADANQAIAVLQKLKELPRYIFVKGSRGLRLEQIFK